MMRPLASATLETREELPVLKINEHRYSKVETAFPFW